MRFRVCLAIAFASGYLALSYELVWYRVFSYVSGGAANTFGYLLAFYLLGIALGSFVVKSFCKERIGNEERGDELKRVAWFVLLSSLVSFLVVPATARLAAQSFPGTVHYSMWQAGFPIVAIAAGLLGATLPLVAHFGIEPDEHAGQRLSYIYLSNILGSSLGSFITGFWWMDAFSTGTICMILGHIGLVVAACIFLVGARGSKARPAHIAAYVLASLAVVIVSGSPKVFDQLYERLLLKTEFKADSRFPRIVEDKHGVVVVNSIGQVYGGGIYDGAFNTDISNKLNGIERAYAIYAMHPKPKRCLVVGLSTGSWTQVLANLPHVEVVDVVEIGAGYLQLIREQPAVASLLSNPKVRIHIDDGRRWLNRHPNERYDFILMNTTYHWRSHSTNLLSQDFMRLVRGHLLPGGIHYFNSTWNSDTGEGAMVHATAVRTYPHALRVVNFMAVSDSPIPFDRERWIEAISKTPIDGHAPTLSAEQGGTRWDELMQFAGTYATDNNAGDPWFTLEKRDSIVKRTENEGVITDDNMLSEWYFPFWKIRDYH